MYIYCLHAQKNFSVHSSGADNVVADTKLQNNRLLVDTFFVDYIIFHHNTVHLAPDSYIAGGCFSLSAFITYLYILSTIYYTYIDHHFCSRYNQPVFDRISIFFPFQVIHLYKEGFGYHIVQSKTYCVVLMVL